MKIINWFQIPAVNLDRAMKFYGDILNATFHQMAMGTEKHAFFALDTQGSERTGGEIIQSAKLKPSVDGVIIYFDAPGGVDAVLSRVEKAGGKITVPKTGIGEFGFIALVLDTEGNQIGLHSM
ncbi:MAG: glyoxalase/bleomycin resistance protein/dioxygenase [Pedosphaera sp.]|nr:glyoxalase/bleomycin resistance protein/dioxygenase [Pedosphaera sp.]